MAKVFSKDKDYYVFYLHIQSIFCLSQKYHLFGIFIISYLSMCSSIKSWFFKINKLINKFLEFKHFRFC